MAFNILRTTPIDSHLASPAQLMNQRKMKSNLPTKVQNLAPNREATQEALERHQTSQKEYFDCRAGTDLRPLQPGQQVWVLDEAGWSHTWEPAIVSTTCSEPRSYEVVTETENIMKQNRRHIWPVQQTQPRHPEAAM